MEWKSDGQRLTFGDVHYSTAPPIRSHDNAVAARAFALKTRRQREPGTNMTRAEMKATRIDEGGIVCRGATGSLTTSGT